MTNIKIALIFTCLILLTSSCIREKKSIQENSAGNNAPAPPPTQPTLTGSIESNVDQWKRLSIGYSVLLNDPIICNKSDLRMIINNGVADNGGFPLRNYSLYNSLKSSNFIFKLPSATTHDLYDALSHVIGSYNPPSAINTWMPDFFSSFLHDFGGNIDPYFINIGIPLRAFQAQNGHWNKPAIVCPDPEVFGFPMTAYSLDGGALIEIKITDDDQYDDLIESGKYFVLSLSYDYEYLDQKEVAGKCEGGYKLNDNICDGNCGENEVNSPSDCGDHTKNKILYLREIKINEDIADRNSKNRPPDRKHWEKAIQGNYEPGFSSWIMNSNGNFSYRKKVMLNKIPFEKVKRTRIKQSGSVISRGNSLTNMVAERNSINYGSVVVSENFNPILSDIYIFFYEHDALKRQNLYSNVPLSFGSVVFDSLFWRGSRGNFTAGKYNSETWGLSRSRFAPPVSPLNFYNIIQSRTAKWSSELYNGDPIMAYYHSDVSNKVNYALYYFVNHR